MLLNTQFWSFYNQTSEQEDTNCKMPEDTNYHHYSLTFKPDEVRHRFKDVRFVLVAGCSQRVEAQAYYLADRLFTGVTAAPYPLERLTKSRSRFTLFKLGPCLLSNHGMGSASMSIAMHELFLMCQQAGVIGLITVLRFGTCEYLSLNVDFLQDHSIANFAMIITLISDDRRRHRRSRGHHLHHRSRP